MDLLDGLQLFQFGDKTFFIYETHLFALGFIVFARLLYMLKSHWSSFSVLRPRRFDGILNH